MTKAILLIIATVVLAIGCGVFDKDCPATVEGYGTVRYVDLEGGFYGIYADDGERYDPINLDEEYQQDGLRIYFEGRIRDDVASFHMWGTLIEITNLRTI